MEDDLKILKVKQLKNEWLDLTNISSLSWGDKTEIENCFKVDYLSNHLSDLTEILK